MYIIIKNRIHSHESIIVMSSVANMVVVASVETTITNYPRSQGLSMGVELKCFNASLPTSICAIFSIAVAA